MIFGCLILKIVSGVVLVSSSSPIGPVVDQLADLALWEAELAADAAQVDPLAVASSLVERLRQVPDPRRLRGLRHPLLVILVLTACATLVAGNDGVTAIRQWAARTPQDVLHRLGARRNPLTGRYLVPSERTFRRVLAGLDGDALDAATCGYAADVVRGDAPSPVIAAADDEPAEREREQRRAVARSITHPAPAGLLPAVAIDGKLLHGTRTEAGQVFLVAAVTHERGVILGQRQVGDKRGETTVIGDLLAPLDVAGMLLTLDALYRIRYNASRVRTAPCTSTPSSRGATSGTSLVLEGISRCAVVVPIACSTIESRWTWLPSPRRAPARRLPSRANPFMAGTDPLAASERAAAAVRARRASRSCGVS
jgi:hypothetical protein